MEVKLLAYTPCAERVIASAGRSCYSDKSASELMESLSDEAAHKQLKIIHGSVFEHAVFTFSVEGVSRVTTHQLVRHRLASFSQQSMRYVDVHKLWDHIVMPQTVQEMMTEYEAIANMAEEYGELTPMNEKESVGYLIHQYMESLRLLIEAMTEAGIPSEDQRYFVPMGVMSNITVTMNLRELQHFCGLRRCNRAQWEIRELADKMAQLVYEACPEFEGMLGPQCVQNCFCPEHKSCGRYATKKEIFDYAIQGKIGEFAHRFKDEMEASKEGE